MKRSNRVAAFWNQPEQVERFAARAADKRLEELLPTYRNPAQTRVLDLGCAGGRNTVLLAKHGFDVYAVDGSPAMVDKTRERLAPWLSRKEAETRVRLGQMEELSDFADGFFHLVVALGIYHNATSPNQWQAALRETARVLAPAGLLLVSNFSPRSQPEGVPLTPVPGRPHLYTGFSSGPLYLLEADAFDAEMRRHGFQPVVPVETVKATTDAGFRVTVNGLYRKS